MIPFHARKIAVQEHAGPLTAIFNQCIIEKARPNIWKKGEWMPVFKKEDPLEKTSYRPITVLTVGTPRKVGWGCVARFPKPLTLFITKICDIPYPIYDLTKTSKPCL